VQPYEIRGHAVAKRAFEIAATGRLKILLVGPLGSGKTTLRDAFPGVESAERETCPCGHHMDVRQSCVCSANTLTRWYRRLERTAREYDIILDVCSVPAKEMLSTRKPDAHEDELREMRVRAAKLYGETHQDLALEDDAAMRTMELALRRLSLTYGQYQAVLRTARAIANLDSADKLKARHVAEAIQYRADATIYRVDRIGEMAASAR
jgi:predicted ATPase with chaperone activity